MLFPARRKYAVQCFCCRTFEVLHVTRWSRGDDDYRVGVPQPMSGGVLTLSINSSAMQKLDLYDSMYKVRTRRLTAVM